MRIIIVYDFAFANGGAAKVAITEAAALAERGYDVTFFSGVGPVDERLKKSGAKIVCLEQEELKNQLGGMRSKVRGALQGFWNRQAKERFASLLAGFQLSDTIVHFHGWSLALSPALFSVTAKSRFKIAITCHDYEVNCPVRTYFNYKKGCICNCKAMSVKCILINCDKRSYLQKEYRILRQGVLRRLLKKNQLSLICLSAFNQSIIEKDLRIPCSKYIVPNLIDIPPEMDVHPERNRNYLFIGRFSPEKGVRLFCEAVTRTKVHGIAIGDGDEMEVLKKEYPDITFCGWLKPEEMVSYIANSRCLIMSSIWYEGAPLTIPEVQCAYAMPCIVPTPCGAQEYIEHGKNGWIYPSGNQEKLISCIEESKNDGLIQKMSRYCRASARKDAYSAQSHVDSLVQVYQSIMR